ncbi:hypothetical protein B0H21DRAFT_670623, partial [Amylocystis lapponica]
MFPLQIGHIVPAGGWLTEAINVSIDQTTLTRELLPQWFLSGFTCEAEGAAIST